MGKMDSMKGVPSTTGATAPKGATSSDKTGERMEKLRGGVAMGKEDAMGSDKIWRLLLAQARLLIKTKPYPA